MAVRVYRSTDPEAPVLDGLAGSLVNVLRKCLVEGYGTVANGTRKDPLGWTALFDGTGFKGAFQSTDPQATGCWLYVDDSGSHAAGTCMATARGYETFGGFDSGGNPSGTSNEFPTGAQQGNYGWAKSTTADATTRAWVLVGDERLFYLFTEIEGGSLAGCYVGHYFGDILPQEATDTYCCGIIGNNNWNAPTDANKVSWFGYLRTTPAYGGSELDTIGYLQRKYDFVGLSSRHHFMGHGSKSYGNANGFSYPNPADQGLLMTPVEVIEAADDGQVVLRGRMPGLYAALQQRPVPSGTVLSSVAELAGRELLALYVYAGNVYGLSVSNCGTAYLDVTGPWR